MRAVRAACFISTSVYPYLWFAGPLILMGTESPVQLQCDSCCVVYPQILNSLEKEF